MHKAKEYKQFGCRKVFFGSTKYAEQLVKNRCHALFAVPITADTSNIEIAKPLNQ